MEICCDCIRRARDSRERRACGHRRTDTRTSARHSAIRSDLTDEEWALVEPHLPPPRQRSRHKSPERRDVLDAILYVLTTGCQWRALPKDFPPRSTVHDYFVDWHGDGTLTRVHNALYCEARELVGKAPTPTLSIVDSQSVKGTERGNPGRSFRLRCGQEDQRCEAPHRRGHARPDARPHGDAGQYSGSGHDRAANDGRAQPARGDSKVPPDGGSRRGHGYRGRCRPAVDDVNLGCGQRLCGAPQALDRERAFGWLGRCRRLTKDFEDRAGSTPHSSFSP